MRTRYSHSWYSTDLLPAAYTRKELAHDLLSPLRNASEPEPNEFVDDFYISPAPVDCER